METKHHIHYALDEDGNLVSIEQAKKGCRYFCIHCHQEMIPNCYGYNIPTVRVLYTQKTNNHILPVFFLA